MMNDSDNSLLPTPSIGVSAIIFNDTDEVLLICRGKEPALGQWSAPGGRLEPGESLVDCCRREVKEETGIDVEPNTILAVVERRFERFHYVIIDFMASLKTFSPLIPQAQSDVSDARWVSVNELESLDLVDGLEEIIMRGYQLTREGIQPGLRDCNGNETDFIPSC